MGVIRLVVECEAHNFGEHVRHTLEATAEQWGHAIGGMSGHHSETIPCCPKEALDHAKEFWP